MLLQQQQLHYQHQQQQQQQMTALPLPTPDPPLQVGPLLPTSATGRATCCLSLTSSPHLLLLAPGGMPSHVMSL
jgi:hypothetical protein